MHCNNLWHLSQGYSTKYLQSIEPCPETYEFSVISNLKSFMPNQTLFGFHEIQISLKDWFLSHTLFLYSELRVIAWSRNWIHHRFPPHPRNDRIYDSYAFILRQNNIMWYVNYRIDNMLKHAIKTHLITLPIWFCNLLYFCIKYTFTVSSTFYSACCINASKNLFTSIHALTSSLSVTLKVPSPFSTFKKNQCR